jgi:tRNA(Ile)-lysidine synthase
MLEIERPLRGKAESELHAAQNLCAALRVAKGVALAVSGGPDSVALMLLAADLRAIGTAPPFFVATVDHGLRPDSRHEAEQVSLWAHALGLPHKILFWQGEKPKTRIQERARAARYDLLCAYAADIGADTIVTAHHADDQAETILFRLLRGSGLKGLSGMAAAAPRGGLIHARPLLDVTKTDLIGICHARGHPFFDDPSNRNPAYARTRMRNLSGVMAENGLDRAALLRLGARAARAEAALQAQALSRVADLQNIADEPAFRADFSSLRHESEEILGRILELKIRAVSGCEAPLRLDRLESLALRLKQALLSGEAFKATLGGVTLHLDRKAYLEIRPENHRRRGFNRPRE